MSLTEIQRDTIDAAIVNGNVIEAVRNHRAYTGSDLAAAKQFVDARHSQLLADCPQRFPSPIPPTVPNPAITDQIVVASNGHLKSVNRLLNKIEKALYGLNYEATLSARVAELPSTNLPAVETIAKLYPDAEPAPDKFSHVTLNELKSDITERLTYEGDIGSGPQFTVKRRTHLTSELIPQLWTELDALTPLEESACVSYNCDIGLPGYYVFWSFAFLIHCPQSNRCSVITGMSSD
jgi:hypothetical protein